MCKVSCDVLYDVVLVYRFVEMVEHDTPPEEREPVLEEPHKKREGEEKKEGGEGESKAMEDQSQPSAPTAEAGDESQPQSGYAGVSTFFSGIASMVQTTVSF